MKWLRRRDQIKVKRSKFPKELSCRDKLKRTEKDAKFAARNAKGIGLIAYKCKHCGRWHLGHK